MMKSMKFGINADINALKQLDKFYIVTLHLSLNEGIQGETTIFVL